MGFAGIGLTQEAHPLGLRLDNHHILVTMRLLLPTVRGGLFFRAFRPLAPTFRSVNDQLGALPVLRLALGKVSGVPFRQQA